MIRLIFKSPTIMAVKTDDDTIAQIKLLLTSSNKSAEFSYNKLKKNIWMKNKYGPEFYDKILKEAKQKINQCLLFSSPEGWWTYTGMVGVIEERFPGLVTVENNLTYPDVCLMPWHFPPKHELRYYQKEAVNALLAARHGAVEICTGAGKTRAIFELTKKIGLKTVIMCPSSSIANQIYEEAKINFGKKRVGLFDATHKQSDKQIIIAVGQSLVRVKKETPHWDELRKVQVFIADESHTTPAETFQKVCFGVFAETPYRFFFSATQIRGDGQKVLLDGIIGPIVYSYPIEKGIQDGFLVPMHFKIIKSKKSTDHIPEDPNENTRLHLFYNQNVIDSVISVANDAVEKMNRKVLILIDEIDQYWRIIGKLKHKSCFAHGGNLDNKQKEFVPKEWHSPDNGVLVNEFNDNKWPIMIGTSAVSTGTDIKAADFIIYWQGGKSEVQVKQAIGRGTRTFPGKTDCIVVDFDVQDVSVVHRHAIQRKDIYKQIGKVTYVEME